MVDRTLNEWSEWQLKNLNAIVWLYRGEVDKYQALVEEYSEALGGRDFDTVLETLEEEKAQLITEGKEAAAAAPRKEKKRWKLTMPKGSGRRGVHCGDERGALADEEIR